jgi:hypothetical protein
MRRLVIGSIAALGLGALFVSAAAAQSDSAAVFTDSQAADGKAAYESVCVNCHTDKLTGRRGDPGETPAIDSLAETFRNGIQQANGHVPPLAGEAFVTRWGSRTAEALTTRIGLAIDVPAGGPRRQHRQEPGGVLPEDERRASRRARAWNARDRGRADPRSDAPSRGPTVEHAFDVSVAPGLSRTVAANLRPCALNPGALSPTRIRTECRRR